MFNGHDRRKCEVLSAEADINSLQMHTFLMAYKINVQLIRVVFFFDLIFAFMCAKRAPNTKNTPEHRKTGRSFSDILNIYILKSSINVARNFELIFQSFGLFIVLCMFVTQKESNRREKKRMAAKKIVRLPNHAVYKID